MTREKSTARPLVRRQRSSEKDAGSSESIQTTTARQRKIEEDLEYRMRSALDDVYRALLLEDDENEADWSNIELVNELIH